MKHTMLMTCIASLLLAMAIPAMAELGGNAASIEADLAHLKASRRVVNAQKYTVHEMHMSSGTVVREFVTAQGQVFAVAWQGPFMPDLRQVLGSYYEPYLNEAKFSRSRRGPVLVQQTDLVVHSGGHMRAFFGRAYLPQLLPTDVQVDEIK